MCVSESESDRMCWIISLCHVGRTRFLNFSFYLKIHDWILVYVSDCFDWWNYGVGSASQNRHGGKRKCMCMDDVHMHYWRLQNNCSSSDRFITVQCRIFALSVLFCNVYYKQ
jgi:hypothetical protein